MLEAHATVEAVEPGYAWVESERQSACGACASSARCGVSSVAKLVDRRLRIRLRDPFGVRPGESVVIGVSEERLLGVAAVVYLVPLFAMVVCALVASAMVGADAAAPLGAAIGLVGSLGWLRFRRRDDLRRERYQPVILRRDAGLAPGLDCQPIRKGAPS